MDAAPPTMVVPANITAALAMAGMNIPVIATAIIEPATPTFTHTHAYVDTHTRRQALSIYHILYRVLMYITQTLGGFQCNT